MATTSKSVTEQAAEAWQNAGKVRKHLMKQIDKLKEQPNAGVDFGHLQKIDGELGTYRLMCMHTIFTDFEYASEHKAEQALWSAHTAINAQYRKILSDLSKFKGGNNAVEKRKFEKVYQNFLRVAQKFYVGYVQRLFSRYDIKELKRLAGVIDVNQVDAADLISPVPVKLYNLVLRSCHATLIRLGDLGRYRVLAKPKKTGSFETAMSYYSLAHDLIPTSGLGLHQQGIISTEEGNNLDTVYHFYRAWATAESHPMVQQNLENKFETIRDQAQHTENGRRRSHAPSQVSAAPRDAFSRWFLQLHATYYKGEPFQQQAELENEVIHRLEQLSRNCENESLLRKATFVNMAAFHIANARYLQRKDDSALRFCQFAMGLNAKFIVTICEAMKDELATIARARVAATDKAVVTQIWANVMHLLPLLRLSMLWLAAQRHEIFGASDASSGFLPSMVQNLSRTITLLCDEASWHEGLSTCPYLLSEDHDLIGFLPLDSSKVPDACKPSYDVNGELKPLKEFVKPALDAHQESLARMLDILRAAYFLAEDTIVPLEYHVAETGLIFEYKSEASIAHGHESIQTTMPSKEASSATEMPPPAPPQPPPQPFATHEPPSVEAESISEQYSSLNLSEEPKGQDDQLQDTVMSMLSPFLKPPTPTAQSNARSPQEPSYGMHSATAEELFGSYSPNEPGLAASPNNVGPSKTFEQLPWKYFHTPTPRKAEMSADGKASGQLPVPDVSPRRVVSDTQSMRAYQMARQALDTFDNVGMLSVSGGLTQNPLLPQSPGMGSGLHAPRISQFSHWSPEYANFPQGSAPTGTSSSQAVPNQTFGNYMPTNSNSFSQDSSLYHGTPQGQRLNYGQAAAQQVPSGPPPSYTHSSNQWKSPRNDTASSYDAAIFDAAMRGG